MSATWRSTATNTMCIKEKKNVSKINAAAGYIVIDLMSCDQISFSTDNNHNN